MQLPLGGRSRMSDSYKSSSDNEYVNSFHKENWTRNWNVHTTFKLGTFVSVLSVLLNKSSWHYIEPMLKLRNRRLQKLRNWKELKNLRGFCPRSGHQLGSLIFHPRNLSWLSVFPLQIWRQHHKTVSISETDYILQMNWTLATITTEMMQDNVVLWSKKLQGKPTG